MKLPEIKLANHFYRLKYGNTRSVDITRDIIMTFNSKRQIHRYEPVRPYDIIREIDPFRFAFKADILYRGNRYYASLPQRSFTFSVYIRHDKPYSLFTYPHVFGAFTKINKEIAPKLNELRLLTDELIPQRQENIFPKIPNDPYINPLGVKPELNDKFSMYILRRPIKFRFMTVKFKVFLKPDKTIDRREAEILDDTVRLTTRYLGKLETYRNIEGKTIQAISRRFNKPKDARVIANGALRAVRQMHVDNPMESDAGEFLKDAIIVIDQYRREIYDFVLQVIEKRDPEPPI